MTKIEITEKMIDNLTELGANRWTKAGRDRLYIKKAAPELIGLRYKRYGTGNISDAQINGEHISNSACGRILSNLDKAFIDLKTGEIVLPNNDKDDLETKIEEALLEIQ